MTQLNLYTTDPASKCRDCIHNHRPSTWCAQYVRTLQHKPPAVLSCSGYQKDGGRPSIAAGAVGGFLLALAVFLAPASGQGGAMGYPAPATITPTQDTSGFPPCWHAGTCPTNTPVPSDDIDATEQALAAQARPWRVWLAVVVR